jgi:hypothetical protein
VGVRFHMQARGVPRSRRRRAGREGYLGKSGELHVNEIFQWTPILWSARALLLVLLAASAWALLLASVRLVRPSTMKRLALDPLPALREVSGSAEIGGQKVAVSAVVADADTAKPVVDNGQEQTLLELTTRLTALEESHRQLRAGTDQVIDRLRSELRHKGEQQS